MTGADPGRERPGVGPGEITWCFSRRHGGVSEGPYDSLNLADHVGDDHDRVIRNRELLAGRLGVSGDRVAVMQAAHGRDVAVVSAGGVVPHVDGLVTTEPGLGLLALAADCVTVALADERAGVIGAVHSGWRGVAVNAVGSVVAAMEQQGARAERIVAALGPAICPGCYEVSAEVQREVAAVADQAAASTRSGTPSLDMHAAITQQLRASGVVRIERDTDCTAETADLYSYRRDGRTGRHGMLIVRWGAE